MSISIKEYCGINNIVTSAPNKKNDVNLKESDSNLIAPNENTLMVEIEGIHAYPYHTRNFTRYMREALKDSQKKWTSPYLKPLIRHHNDQNGKIIGRVYDATYTEETSLKDVGGLIFTVSVPDKEAEYEVENRLLETVSIGVSTDDVRCSICGEHIIDANEGCPNGHIRGAKYDGETCYWDIYSIEPKELSYVIVPSDAYAKNLRVYRAKDSNNKSSMIPGLRESVDPGINKTIKVKEGEPVQSMDLEKELAEVKAKNEELQADLDKAKEALAELEDLKAKNAELEKTLAEVKAAVEEKTTALKDTEAKLAVSEENFEAAVQEKEAAEKMGLEVQEKLRAIAEDTLNQYRRLAGKSALSDEDLKEREINSLMDSIKDVKEELSDKVPGKLDVQESQIPNQKIPNPVAPTDPKPKKTPEVKDRISLSEGLIDLFTQVSKLK